MAAATDAIQGWRLPRRPHAASSPRCGGIHMLLPPFILSLVALFFFFLHRTYDAPPLPLSFSVSLSLLTPLSLCLGGPPLGWLLLAAPMPPTLSLDMLFIGLQRGWLSALGGCCLKQCSLNKRGRSSQIALLLMCLSEDRTLDPPLSFSLLNLPLFS